MGSHTSKEDYIIKETEDAIYYEAYYCAQHGLSIGPRGEAKLCRGHRKKKVRFQ